MKRSMLVLFFSVFAMNIHCSKSTRPGASKNVVVVEYCPVTGAIFSR